MSRPKKTGPPAVAPEAVRGLARRIQSQAPSPKQRIIGAWLGEPGEPISQPVISRVLATIKEPSRPYLQLERQLAERMADKVDATLEQLAAEELERAGMDHAEAPSTKDMIPNRGRALTFLSGPEYPADLIAAMRDRPVPKGATSWTHQKWAEHFMRLKMDWESGLIDLPGVRRRKM